MAKTKIRMMRRAFQLRNPGLLRPFLPHSRKRSFPELVPSRLQRYNSCLRIRIRPDPTISAIPATTNIRLRFLNRSFCGGTPACIPGMSRHTSNWGGRRTHQLQLPRGGIPRTSTSPRGVAAEFRYSQNAASPLRLAAGGRTSLTPIWVLGIQSSTESKCWATTGADSTTVRVETNLALPIQRVLQQFDGDLTVPDILTMDHMIGKSTLDAGFESYSSAGFCLNLAAARSYQSIRVLSYIVA